VVGEAGEEGGEGEEPSAEGDGPEFGFGVVDKVDDFLSDGGGGLGVAEAGGAEAGFFAGDFEEFGGGGEGVDGGYVDLFGFQFDAHGFCEGELCGFGHGVDAVEWEAAAGGAGGDGDDVASCRFAPPYRVLFDHDGGGGLHGVEGAFDVGGDDVFELGVGGFVDFGEEAVAGVGDHDVEAGEFFECGGDEAVDVFALGDIAGEGEGLRTEGLALGGDLFEFVEAAGSEDEVVVLLGEGEGGGGADAGGGAGDDDGFGGGHGFPASGECDRCGRT
jgi:hypothetical protein